ncbi:MAG: methyltransferase domain-containing protein [Nitriliruptor sp.]|nr:MAG: methyltransferase domain-containing protein [Nitriliruptor sp.]
MCPPVARGRTMFADGAPGGHVAEQLHRIEVPVQRHRREILAAQLWARGAVGVWERPATTVAWFSDPAPSLSDEAGLVPELAAGEVVWSREVDRDWQAAWKATITPIRAGRTVVVPSWLADEHVPTDQDELTLVLDPGQAFGTGHHATTALCLELLDDLDLAGGLAGRTVADIGCGSGILAIAAAGRGARAQAVDVDPDAVAVTRDNARRNGVEVAATTGSVAAIDAPAEVVVANLISDVVVALAAELVAACRRVLIVSGLTTERADDVLASLTAAGAEVEQVRERDGWIAAKLVVPASDDPRDQRRSGETRGVGRGRGNALRGLLLALLLLVAALLGAACTTPDVEEAPEAGAEPTDGAAELDPDSLALVAEVEEVRELVAEIAAELETAADAGDLTAVQEAAATADGLLVADPGDDGRALFPGQTAERTEGPDTEDAFTGLLTLARDVGGPLGRSLVEALRDPIAGDLGAWELDAPGAVANAREATEGATDEERATERVLALDGEAKRAIAWVALARSTGDVDLARAAATRATDHLEVIDIALSGITERTLAPPETDASDDAGEELGPGVDDGDGG